MAVDLSSLLQGPPEEPFRPEIVEPQVRDRAIDSLRPGTDLHSTLLAFLLRRLDASEREMSRLYARWRVNELRVQAYVDLPEWEKRLKEMNEKGEPSRAVRVSVPFAFATLNTMVTFLLHAFTGRRPMFQVGAYKDEAIEAARLMETKLQYDADHTRLVKVLGQFFLDICNYGLGACRVTWTRQERMRTQRRVQTAFDLFDQPAGTENVVERVMRLVFEGSEVFNIDPFMFFPDPRVPMYEVNKRGEFVFWRSYESILALKREEGDTFEYLDQIGDPIVPSNYEGDSNRARLVGGDAFPGRYGDRFAMTDLKERFHQIDQGVVDLIPKDHGLSDSTRPEYWIFTVGNKRQIIQAEPYDFDHGMLPVVVSTPLSLGYSFGQAGPADYVGPIQDVLSWLVNSRIQNARLTLNNMFVIDPSRVEMQDFKKSGPGMKIRLKQSAFGQDVKTALSQLPVQDVTTGHFQDFNLFSRIGQLIMGTSENVMGIQSQGGRKTATEVRQSGEAAVSRMAALSRIISAQAMVDLTEQMALNNQQWLSPEFYITVVGKDGMKTPIYPTNLVGDFHFPIHDGTLPLDRVALMDIWKEVFSVITQDQELRQGYSVPKIFEHIAELGGARNIESMRLQARPQAALEAQAQAGNAVPLRQSPLVQRGAIPARRAAGALA